MCKNIAAKMLSHIYRFNFENLGWLEINKKETMTFCNLNF